MCLKCCKPDHIIRDYPMRNGENKKCVKFGGDKNKSRDHVCDKSSRRETVYHVVKKALFVSGDFSSDSRESEYSEDASMLAVKDDEDVFDVMFAFMAK